jgi:hypothetical protein
MSVNKIPLDALIYDQHMYDWLMAGLSKEQIIQKSRQDWPSVSKDYLETTYTITLNLIEDERATANKAQAKAPIQEKAPATAMLPASDDFDPSADLLVTHCRRSKLLEQLDERIAQDNAPVTLLNLYRGLLRDHEASCYKLIDRPVAPRITPPTPMETKPNLPTPEPKTGQSLTTVLAAIVLFLCTLFHSGNSTKATRLKTSDADAVALSCGTPFDTTVMQWPTMHFSGLSTQDSRLNATPPPASLPAMHSSGCRAS